MPPLFVIGALGEVHSVYVFPREGILAHGPNHIVEIRNDLLSQRSQNWLYKEKDWPSIVARESGK